MKRASEWRRVEQGDEIVHVTCSDPESRPTEAAVPRPGQAPDTLSDWISGESLAMLGHEFRNPLSAMRSAVMALDQVGKQSEEAVRLRAIIARQIRHVDRLVDELLDVPRVTTGNIVLDWRPVDLREIASEALSELYQCGRAGDHELSLLGGPAVVEGDRLRLHQVIRTLLDNAVKYTPAGGRVEVSIERAEREAIVRVRDSGIGIGPDLLPRLSDLFSQGRRLPDRAVGRLRIGLALARRLVELHGGTIGVQSTGPGHGSEFTVRLPGSAATVGTVVEGDSQPSRVQRRVLLVEDHHDTRDAFRLLLEVEGHSVEEAADGRAGLEKILALRPDLAFVDLGLPGLDGYAVARAVRTAPDGNSLWLIAMTADGRPEDRQRALEAGFDAFVVKPIGDDELRALLSRQLSESRRGRNVPPPYVARPS
jgi:CheY-like chemotaxis protein